jgi:aldose 1-epimerase
VEREPDRVVMRTTLHPREGYPFMLDIDVAYEVSDAGLAVTTAATNVGDSAAPYAAGQHPYLSAGDGVVDECTLRFDAGTRIVTDEERQLPTGREAVEGTSFDFRSPRPIGDLRVDFAFTDLARDDDGLAWVALEGTDGAGAELWVDAHYPFVEIYTGDALPESRRRQGLACEPMTCPPNGLQTGEGVVRLEPGESSTARWRARLA